MQLVREINISITQQLSYGTKLFSSRFVCTMCVSSSQLPVLFGILSPVEIYVLIS